MRRYRTTASVFAQLSNAWALVLSMLLLIPMALTSCQDRLFDRDPLPNEENTGNQEVKAEADMYEVTIPYLVPSADEASSLRGEWSIEAENEIYVEDVRAFVFNLSPSGDWLFNYEAPVSKVEPKANTKNKEGLITFLIKDSAGENQKIIFTVKADKQATQVPPAGTNIKEFYKSFTFVMRELKKENETPWGLPMSAETKTFTYSHSANNPVSPIQTDPITFLRSVARVDIFLGTLTGDQFDETGGGIDKGTTSAPKKIQLSYVRYHNADEKGHIIPNPDVLENAATASVKVNAATQVAGANSFVPEVKWETTASSDAVDTFKRQLYVVEHANTPEGASYDSKLPGNIPPSQAQLDGYMKRPYLVVGLRNTKEVTPENKYGTSYYRIDFLKRNGNEATATYEYLPILRNHRYLVNIVDVKGPGFDTPEDAAKGPAANIMYNVVVWSESEMSDVKYDGQYMLGVSTDQIVGFRSGGTYNLTIHTSWPKGWRIEPNANTPEYLVKTLVDRDTSGKITNYKYKSTPGKETEKEDLQMPMNPLTEEEWEQYTPDASDSKKVRKKVPSGEHKDKEGNYGTFDVVAGRMRWTIHTYQLKEFKISARAYSDPECTQPLQYLQIHELGKALAADSKLYTGTNPEIDDKYKGTWNNGTESVEGFGFTGKEAGAIRYFYVKYEGPTDGKKVEIKPADGNDSRFEVKEIPDTELNGKNIYKYSVTAEEMKNEDNKFETHHQEYEIIASSDATTEKGIQTITFNQTEYNVYLYLDKGLTYPVNDDYTIRMDGQPRTYYIKSNIDYKVELVNQYGTADLTSATLMDTDNSLKSNFAVPKFSVHPHGTDKTVVYNGPASGASYTGVSNVNGLEFKMDIVNDIATPKLFLATAKWVFSVDPNVKPYHNYKVRTDTYNYISATILPEANSYPLELGGIGVLIPLSQINKAADMYNSRVEKPYNWEARATDPNIYQWGWELDWHAWISKHKLNRLDDDDNPTAEVLWCDAKSATGSTLKPPINQDGTVPLRYIRVIGNYLLVIPGDSSADSACNIVVGIRSSKHDRVTDRFPPEADNGKKALIWSFHLMMFENGKVPKELYIHTKTKAHSPGDKIVQYFMKEKKNEEDEVNRYPIISWPYDLGALKRPTRKNSNGDPSFKDNDYRTIGLGYQFGRKDPFPFYENTTNSTKKFVNGDGVEVKFHYAPIHSTLRSSTMSVRESIENPMALCSTHNRYQWMTEGQDSSGGVSNISQQSAWQVVSIWGASSSVGSAAQRRNNSNFTTKTPFDPCPYGFCVPQSGEQSSQLINQADPENQWAFGANVIRVINLGDNITSNDHTYRFNGVSNLSNGTTLGTWTSYATSNIYYLDNEYPQWTIALAGAINDKYQTRVQKADLIFVRPFVNLSNWIAKDYNRYLPPYTESWVPPIQDRTRSF